MNASDGEGFVFVVAFAGEGFVVAAEGAGCEIASAEEGFWDASA